MDFKIVLLVVLLLIPLLAFSQKMTVQARSSLFPSKKMTVRFPAGTRILKDRSVLAVPVFFAPKPQPEISTSLPAWRFVHEIPDCTAVRFLIVSDTLARWSDSASFLQKDSAKAVVNAAPQIEKRRAR